MLNHLSTIVDQNVGHTIVVLHENTDAAAVEAVSTLTELGYLRAINGHGMYQRGGQVVQLSKLNLPQRGVSVEVLAA